MSKAFLMLEAHAIEHGPILVNYGRVEQETRLYEDGRCICVLKVTYPPGSPVHDAAMEEWRRQHPGVATNNVNSFSVQPEEVRS